MPTSIDANRSAPVFAEEADDVRSSSERSYLDFMDAAMRERLSSSKASMPGFQTTGRRGRLHPRVAPTSIALGADITLAVPIHPVLR